MINSGLRKAIGVPVVRVHATNVIGLGATRLAQSLLPAMEQLGGYDVRTVYLPYQGTLAGYRPTSKSTTVVRRKRRLPNAISRVIECTLLGRRFEGEGSLLVLGDIPLRCSGRQTVFVQTPLLTRSPGNRGMSALKYWIAQRLFRLNASFASAFIVQTQAMRDALSATYPEILSRIHVIGQPAPDWLLSAGLKRTGVMQRDAPGLHLFYPAAGYPHKNHRLLSRAKDGREWPVSSLTLTIPSALNPNPELGWIRCVDRLDPNDVLSTYGAADGLLFLSTSESFGFPLVEAMSVGLPIICPDLAYARVLCGAGAIYFDPQNIDSLYVAITELRERLRNGWWPDWRLQLESIPESWSVVAAAMLLTTCGVDREPAAEMTD